MPLVTEESVMIAPADRQPDIVSFGPFILAVKKRLLTKDGVVVELGTRAMDLLITFALHPNEVMSKRELLAQAWPDVTVEEGSLRFQIASLRKAIGDGVDGVRYIATLTGRGYSFVAPVAVTENTVNRRSADVSRLLNTNMPNRPLRVIGRQDDIIRLSQQLLAHRFVTIVGTGGVGKTTVAVELAHDLADTFGDAVLFVDLGTISDPNLVPTAVASMLGLTIPSDDPTPGIIAYLRDKRILLIFDTCEHLIDAVAALTTRIFGGAPKVHVLATSREALQVEGERIYRLAPLVCPPENTQAMAAIIHEFPATQLFIERAAANGSGLDLTDADAEIVAGICRQLNGVALAIELTARRVEAYGLQQIAAHLDQTLALSWAGARNAPARQKTLLATLSWSYGLLSEQERIVLRRLAIFVGDFTIEAALAVVTNETIDEAMVFNAVDSLVAKSIIVTRPTGAMMRYRLLDTTRAYALGLSDGSSELASRHAIYYRHWLVESGNASNVMVADRERSSHLAALNNVRAALEWCFGETGDVGIGINLAAAAAPIFLAMSLLPECHRWSERALLAMDHDVRGGREEMHFQAAIGVSVMFIRGGHDTAREALYRSLAIAEKKGGFDELQVLGPLQLFHLRTGDFNTALGYARRCQNLAVTLDDPVAETMARCLLGMSLHFAGAYSEARVELETAIRMMPRTPRTTIIHIGLECRILASAVLARTLWLQGHAGQAVKQAQRTVAEAAEAGHSLSLCIALIWYTNILLWTGDFERAQQNVDWLMSLAEPNSLTPYIAIARTFSAELAFRRGGDAGAAERLQEGIGELNAAPYGMFDTSFAITLIEALTAAGRPDEAMALLDQTFEQVEAKGDACYIPELLRMKSLVLSVKGPHNGTEIERTLVQSLETSRRQTAGGWELRAGIDLARLLASRGLRDDARSLLEPLCARRDDRFETMDSKLAVGLLATWK
jgi:predicted ATPase/DNA-binding winged helix-turn-helix (wHTH) protein